MRYRVMMSVVVEAPGDHQARQTAVKLLELLKSPMVKMAAGGQGIQLSGDGQPQVHHPLPEHG